MSIPPDQPPSSIPYQPPKRWQSPPPRRPLVPSVIVCWIIIAAICVLIPVMNARHSRSESITTTAPANPPTTAASVEGGDIVGLQPEIAGKYAVGVSQLDKGTVPVLITQLHQLANTPAEKLAVGVVIGEVGSTQEAIARIESSGSPDAPAFLQLLNNAQPLPEPVLK